MLKFLVSLLKREKEKQPIVINQVTSKQDNKDIVKHNYYDDSNYKEHALIDLFNYTNIGAMNLNCTILARGIIESTNNKGVN